MSDSLTSVVKSINPFSFVESINFSVNMPIVIGMFIFKVSILILASTNDQIKFIPGQNGKGS